MSGKNENIEAPSSDATASAEKRKSSDRRDDEPLIYRKRWSGIGEVRSERRTGPRRKSGH